MNQSIVPAITPAVWGPRGRGAEISYTIVDSPFGRMLVAVTACGICALSVHQSDEWQQSELRRDFRSFRTDRVIDATYLDEKYPERRDALRAKWRQSLVWEPPRDA